MTLKEMREASGMTQEQFARHYGIPLRTYQSWEGGERKPAPYIVKLIERVFRVEKDSDR